MTRGFQAAAAVLLLLGCRPASVHVPSAETPEVMAAVVHTFPHDPRAFTQGLVYYNGFLYESTGIYGRSSLRKTVPETGEIVQKVMLPHSVFAEGLALCKGRLIQITWHAETGYVYDAETLTMLRTFRYKGEGWGLCCDGSRLIMSDGSSTLTFLDAETFEPSGRIEVTDGGQPLSRLNELEYVNGLIYANVWKSDRIACIDPQSGSVVRWINCEALRPRSPMRTEDVLNGIAWDADGKRLFVTGKLWGVLYEITSGNCSATEWESEQPAPEAVPGRPPE